MKKIIKKLNGITYVAIKSKYNLPVTWTPEHNLKDALKAGYRLATKKDIKG